MKQERKLDSDMKTAEKLKRAVKGEYLTAKDFISVFDKVREWNDIHTGNVKTYIKRQQTPFIALLHCAGILE